MQLKIYTILDTVSTVFGRPFFMLNDQVAIRSFNNLAKDPNSEIASNPTDYKLYTLGEYDDETGRIESAEIPGFVANLNPGNNFIEKEE